MGVTSRDDDTTVQSDVASEAQRPYAFGTWLPRNVGPVEIRFTQWKLRKKITAKRAWKQWHKTWQTCPPLEATRQTPSYARNISAGYPIDERRMKLLGTLLQPLTATAVNNAIVSPVSLTPPTDMPVPEYYIHLLRSYVRGSSEAKHWPRDGKTGFINEDTVPAWCISVMTATVVMKEGKYAEANRFLQHFIKQAPKSRPDVSQRLLRAMCRVSETLPWAGSSHPLRLLLQLMLRLGIKNIMLHATKIILVYVNIIYETLGAAYPIVQDMLSDTIWRLL
ncbi:hypothetical protein FZEAL_2888 [Fusarium zealandicum]|uniref:Uncharacterized protein n=1 Tax=Fusarium zealandicum TaxID=1053134 RepID=A0A8H4XMC0_9HYPO|nr:hypothetical protein FZEAL_2888 [Fusarium zealandicum]